MKCKLVLSIVLLTVCFVSFGQGTASASGSGSAEKGLIKVSIMYPYSEGKTFNMDYYETKHMPMVAGYLGSNLVKYTIEKGLASGMPNQPLPYMAIGIFYIKNLKEYQSAIAPNIATIRADFANYTNVIPTVLVSEVVR